jgi:sterol desaturase/sphingolipid hydroxylase (fatty acid hydroxylase superfamily)
MALTFSGEDAVSLLGTAASVWCESAARIWWLEPLIATLSFALWVNIFSVLENQKNKSKDDTVPHDWLYWLGLRPFSFTTPAAGIAYWCGVFIWISLVPSPNTPSGCDLTLATACRFLIELVFGIVWYDATFFAIHVAMHKGPRWIRRLTNHKQHHGHHQEELCAMHVLEHSLVDGTFQVLVNIMVQRSGLFGPKMRITRWIHNVVVTYLLTESHANLDVLPLASRFPQIFSGVRFHRQHHNTGGAPYEQFFTYLDRFFFGFNPTSRGVDRSKMA